MPNDQEQPPRDTPPNPAGQSPTFALVRAEFQRTVASIPAFSDSAPSSPNAYNAIGKAILASFLDAVDEIDALGLPYHHNLGVALFSELHTRACYHYYQEYDRLQGLTETAAPSEIRRSRRSGADLLAAARRRLPRVGLPSRGGAANVAYAGTSTFTWPALRTALARDGITLRNGATGKPRTFPRTDVQAAMLRAWAHAIHADVASMLGVAPSTIDRYGPDPVGPLLARMASSPTLGAHTPDLLVTGTLGEFGTRLTALTAMARGVPVLTIHHGAQYMIWDEPYYELYEGFLPDFKIVYGDPQRQRETRAVTSPVNVRGSETRLFPRTDKTIRRLHSTAPISALESLQSKSVLYLASEFESVRYGPFRDVHPSTYRAWQHKLLAWLRDQTGTEPGVRLHPKRPSTHFDPLGYPLNTGDLFQAIDQADVLVVDYPTTSLPMAAATSKPVLYFDLGLRQLFPAAIEAIEARCVTATTDILAPEAGFATMQANLGKSCTDTFSSMFSIAPNSTDEVSDTAKAIAQALATL
jgi:hypothetical protein